MSNVYMSLAGFWKGEYILDKDSTVENEEVAVPTILEIKKHDLLSKSLEGIFMEDEQISGISESAEILGSARIVNEITFVKRLARFYYRKPDGSIGIVDEPHPDVYYNGKLLNKDYIVGSWKIHATYRKIDNVINQILPASGHWWVKRIR